MKAKFRSPDDLWMRASTHLGYELEPAIRGWLLNQGYVDDVLTADEPMPAFERLLQAAREARSMINFAIEDRKRASTGKPNQARTPARYTQWFSDDFVIEEEGESESEPRKLLGLLIAKRIERSGEAVKFRKEFLAGHLLEGWEVSSWIERYAPDGAPLDRVYSAMGFILDEFGQQYVIQPVGSYYGDLVSSPYSELSPEDRLQHVGGADTPLGQLVLLAMQFSTQIGWAYGETLWFLLTGKHPQLPLIRAFPVKILSDSGPRILMEVATEAAPDEVRKAYKDLRERMKANKRSRELTLKISAFVKFVLEQDGVDPDKPQDWQVLVTHWNELQNLKDTSWQIEPHERRRIANIYKRAIDAIQTFSRDFYYRKEAEEAWLKQRAEQDLAELDAAYESIYGDPWKDSFGDPEELLYGDPWKDRYGDLRRDTP